ncbi:MAG TPA: right-handed parallel beta-helix repeat-containing protein [Propionibacteriaceae bacterium]
MFPILTSVPCALTTGRTRLIALLALLAVVLLTALVPSAQASTNATVPSQPTGLDKTGNSVPRTNYPIPAGAIFISPRGLDANPGTQAAPVKTINQAVKLAPDGGTIVMREGQYRDWFHDLRVPTTYGIITKALTFQAYPGESPWFNGSDLKPASAWTKTDGVNQWSMNWSTPNFCDGQYYSRPLTQQQRSPNAGPCAHFDMTDPTHPVAGDPQMVFANATPLRQVDSLSAVGPKSFFYDWNARRMHIGLDPASKTLEVAVRPMALVLSNKGAGFRILGVGFHRYADNEFHNMTNSVVYVGGSKTVIENSVFAYNASAGVSYSNPPVGSGVRRTIFAYNGYTALGANGGSQRGIRNDFFVEGSVFYRNNTENFGLECTISCGQAAAKFTHMVGLTLTNNLVEETGGSAGGLWCDLNCRDTKIIYNTIRNNRGAGIFYEVSSQGIIAGNVISGSSFGISVASASTKVYNNTLVDNVQGINVYDDQRSRGVNGIYDVGPDTRDVTVVNNVVSGNNYSLMAAGPRVSTAPPNTSASDLFTRVDHNIFFQGNGTAPIYAWWRDPSGQVSSYRTSASFAAARGYEQNSTWLDGSTDPLFENKAAGDYRLREGTAAYQSAETLPSDVAAAMGIPAYDSSRSRGAFAMP